MSSLRSILSGEDASAGARLLTTLLAPVAVGYAAAAVARGALYGSGILETKRLPRPVISVGNITAGGTGKTPTAAFLARHLVALGLKTAVLSRGYGGNVRGPAIVSDGKRLFLGPEAAGDEPSLLARLVPGLQVVVGADRHAAGELALRELDPDVFLLDDGFQHRRLHRDLDILLLDCRRPFGNGRCLPAGLLREPRQGVRRADIVLFTRCICGDAARVPFPGYRSSHRLRGLMPLAGGEMIPFGVLSGARGGAFAGIAEPERFFRDLERQGLTLHRTNGFPDHRKYGEEDVAALAALDVDYLVTTEKDAVKLSGRPFSLPVYAARMEIEVENEAELLARVTAAAQGKR